MPRINCRYRFTHGVTAMVAAGGARLHPLASGASTRNEDAGHWTWQGDSRRGGAGPVGSKLRRRVSVARRLLGVDDCAQPGASALGYIGKRDPDMPLVLERHLRDPHHPPVGANRVFPQLGVEFEQESRFHRKELGGAEPDTALAEVGGNQVPDAIAIPGRLLYLLRAYRAVEWNSRVSPSLCWTTRHRDQPPSGGGGRTALPRHILNYSISIQRVAESGRRHAESRVVARGASRAFRARTGVSLSAIKHR
jgi:hypothetical protein